MGADFRYMNLWHPGSVRGVRAHSGNLIESLDEAINVGRHCEAIAISPDRRVVALADRKGRLSMRSLLDGSEVYSPGEPLAAAIGARAHPVRVLTFDPSGEVLASGGPDGILRLWNLRACALSRTLVGHEIAVQRRPACFPGLLRSMAT